MTYLIFINFFLLFLGCAAHLWVFSNCPKILNFSNVLIKNNLHISGTTQYKIMLFKGWLSITSPWDNKFCSKSSCILNKLREKYFIFTSSSVFPSFLSFFFFPSFLNNQVSIWTYFLTTQRTSLMELWWQVLWISLAFFYLKCLYLPSFIE